MLEKLHARIQEASYTRIEWAAANPTLLKGEKGFVSDDPNLFKIGDGVTPWNELPWRGYSGTISQVFGNNENTVISQKVVTERFIQEETAREEGDKAEAAAREEADLAEAKAREEAISAEAQAREEADAAEAQTREDGINEEASKREASDAVHDSRILELEKAQWPLEVAIELPVQLLEYTGEEQLVDVTYSVKHKGVLKQPTNLTLAKDGADLEAEVVPTKTVSVGVNKLGDTEFVLSASAHSYRETESEETDDIITGSDKQAVKMVLPIYAGFGTSATEVCIDDNKLSVRTSASGTYSKTSAQDGVNFFILVPATFQRLTSFTMGGAPFVMATSEITAGKFNKEYVQYKSGAVYNTGATVNIKAS